MSHKVGGYASDVTDEQWALIEPLIPVYKWGRPRELDMRSVVNAVFYIDKTGCQWEMLPSEYPNHNSVYHHFQRWSREGAWEMPYANNCVNKRGARRNRVRPAWTAKV